MLCTATFHYQGIWGIHTKKYIITGTVAAVCIAALLSAILPLTGGTSAAPTDRKGISAAAAVEHSALIDTVFGDRDLAASSAEDTPPTEADAPDAATSDEPSALTADSIPAVTGLTREGESADSLRLLWDEIPGVQGYRVYRQDLNTEGSGCVLFSTVTNTTLDIRNLSAGSKYSFKIAAYITDSGETYEGEAAEAVFATVPTGINGFAMVSADKSSTAIAWEKNERADGYWLERGFSGEWSDHQTFDADTAEFTDTGLIAGRAYFYRIRPFREDSVGKIYGEPSTVFTVAGLLGPKNSGSASKLGRVSLDYEKSAYADGYEIFYSTDRENWEQLTDTAKTHYSTSRLIDGETYFFRILPYREVGTVRVRGTATELSFVAKKEIYDKIVGDTYVEVSLSDQHMWYIVDGDVYLESDCVTGNYGSADTPKGYFAVNNKISPCTLKGDDYVSYVTYWMPFIGGGWGLHDASWRSKFGGNIYKGDGSHGCVNLPTDIAKRMYAHIEIGTPVIVY